MMARWLETEDRYGCMSAPVPTEEQEAEQRTIERAKAIMRFEQVLLQAFVEHLTINQTVERVAPLASTGVGVSRSSVLRYRRVLQLTVTRGRGCRGKGRWSA